MGSKQPWDARDRMRLLRQSKTLVLPEQRDPRQLWLLIRQDPGVSRGCFFVTHGRNYDKFAKRPGFHVLAHSYDRAALTQAAREGTLAGGEAYQPKFSAHAASQPEPKSEGSPLILPANWPKKAEE